MAMPHTARRSALFLVIPFSILACLAAVLPAGAGARLAQLKPAAATRPGRFTLFESGQVRPLALSPSGFILQVTYPSNPVRKLDNQLTADQQAGLDFFMNNVSDFTNRGTCASCHVLDPHANEENGVAAPGFFGTDGRYTFDGGTEGFKTPHLRNQYQKVGMFGLHSTATWHRSSASRRRSRKTTQRRSEDGSIS
jgi:hypothetical protein